MGRWRAQGAQKSSALTAQVSEAFGQSCLTRRHPRLNHYQAYRASSVMMGDQTFAYVLIPHPKSCTLCLLELPRKTLCSVFLGQWLFLYIFWFFFLFLFFPPVELPGPALARPAAVLSSTAQCYISLEGKPLSRFIERMFLQHEEIFLMKNGTHYSLKAAD